MNAAASSASPAAPGSSRLTAGHAAAVTAFLIWGVLPLYLHLLVSVPAVQIMLHRLVWCCLFVLLWLAARGQLGGVRTALADRRTALSLAASATLISGNWLLYVWAANAGHVQALSLGYFVNPLLNVLLGVVVLRERLDRARWFAVGLAVLGVAWITAQTGRLPWIGLSLALSFSLYGLIRKTVAVEAAVGLGTETLLIAPFAVAYLLWLQGHGGGAIRADAPGLAALLVAGGLVTAVPLSLFSYGARRIPYSTIGLIQYLSPTLLLGLSRFLYHEPFPAARAVGFVLIWSGLAIYAGDGLLRTPRSRG